MTHELYKQTLLGGEVVRLLNTRIASSNHRLHTIVVNKKSFSGYDDKRFILSDQVSTLPYGHNSLREDMFYKAILDEPDWGSLDASQNEQESTQQARDSSQQARVARSRRGIARSRRRIARSRRRIARSRRRIARSRCRIARSRRRVARSRRRVARSRCRIARSRRRVARSRRRVARSMHSKGANRTSSRKISSQSNNQQQPFHKQAPFSTQVSTPQTQVFINVIIVKMN